MIEVALSCRVSFTSAWMSAVQRLKRAYAAKDGKLLHTFEGPTENEKGSDRVIGQHGRNMPVPLLSKCPLPGTTSKASASACRDSWTFRTALLTSPNLAAAERAAEELSLRAARQAGADQQRRQCGGARRSVGRRRHEACPISVTYTLGTGVGGGIVIDGRISSGFTGMAGELGHIAIVPDLEAIQCGCGKKAAWRRSRRPRASSAWPRTRWSGATRRCWPTAKNYGQGRVRRGQSRATRRRSASSSARRTISASRWPLVAVVVNPKRFIIGGGVSKAGEYLFEQVREAYSKHALEARERAWTSCRRTRQQCGRHRRRRAHSAFLMNVQAGCDRLSYPGRSLGWRRAAYG